LGHVSEAENPVCPRQAGGLVMKYEGQKPKVEMAKVERKLKLSRTKTSLLVHAV